MGKKRLFIGMLGACILFLFLFIYYIWQLVFGREFFFRISLGVFLLLVSLVILVGVVGIVGLVWSILRGKDYVLFQKPVVWTLNAFYPLIIGAAKLFRITQDRIQASFIEVNNKLVEARYEGLAADKLMILLPHCLQAASCPHKITGSLANCRSCGGCTVGTLKSMALKYGVVMEVVPGGTLARQAVKRHRPSLVVAVACERDLSSGIMDSSPVPVYGLLNERPHGPCYNTRINGAKMEAALKKFLKGGD